MVQKQAVIGNGRQPSGEVWRVFYDKGRNACLKGNYNDAANAFLAALELNPSAAEVHHDLAVVWHMMAQYESAIAFFEKAVALNSTMTQAWFNGGNTLCSMNRTQDAIGWFRRALELQPDFAAAHYNLAKAYRTMGKQQKAFSHYQKVIQFDPNMPEAHNNMGTVLLASGMFDKALACFKQAIHLKPNYSRAVFNYGLTLNRKGLAGEAIAYAQSCIRMDPENGEALALLVSLLQQTCNWPELEQAELELDRLTKRQLADGLKTSESPFLNFTRSMDVQQNLAISGSWSRHLTASHPFYNQRFTFTRNKNPDKCLKIAYLSERFRNAATAHLTSGIFARHNRKQFEIFAYSWGQDDGSYYRKKIENDVDHFIDIRNVSDFDAAKRIHADGIDILVDMMGWMYGNRISIAAQRPAPVQVNYQGYPGTTGAEFMDYFLADQVVIPEGHKSYYSENVVWLPYCYQANDPQTPVDSRIHTRREYGLPENEIVFCSFNTDYKIEPSAFRAWMRILHRVPNSVLWLLGRSPEARRNLCNAAETLGVQSQRLIFAGPLPKAQHIARLKLADLALDTFTVNGHTTTSDSLIAGVPVITCLGNHFASRVAASILQAIGMNQLVAHDVSDYEHLAARIAQNETLRKKIKGEIEKSKSSGPLFDIDRYVNGLEDAFRMMWHNHVNRGDLFSERSA